MPALSGGARWRCLCMDRARDRSDVGSTRSRCADVRSSASSGAGRLAKHLRMGLSPIFGFTKEDHEASGNNKSHSQQNIRTTSSCVRIADKPITQLGTQHRLLRCSLIPRGESVYATTIQYRLRAPSLQGIFACPEDGEPCVKKHSRTPTIQP